MPKASTIKTLPKKVLDEINQLLVDGVVTLDQIVDHLEAAGHPRSRSALGRYKQDVDQVAAQIRESREMAAALGQEIGPDLAEGKFGRVLIEILQNLAFKQLMSQSESEFATEPMDLMRLAKTLKDMASAQKIDTDRELIIRADERNKAITESAEAGEEILAEDGVSKETIEKFRNHILGIAS